MWYFAWQRVCVIGVSFTGQFVQPSISVAIFKGMCGQRGTTTVSVFADTLSAEQTHEDGVTTQCVCFMFSPWAPAQEPYATSPNVTVPQKMAPISPVLAASCEIQRWRETSCLPNLYSLCFGPHNVVNFTWLVVSLLSWEIEFHSLWHHKGLIPWAVYTIADKEKHIPQQNKTTLEPPTPLKRLTRGWWSIIVFFFFFFLCSKLSTAQQ